MEDFRNNLRRWLLDGPQLSSGEHRGGVCGWLREGEVREYVYPEITGYYLSWLAFLEVSGEADDQSRHCIDRALDWLERVTRERALMSTRHYLDGASAAASDWRNAALFCFDVGMIYRGLGALWNHRPDPRIAELASRLAGILWELRSDEDGFASHLVLDHTVSIPARWSTGPGIHLLKVASGVRAIPLPHDRDLAAIADRTVEQFGVKLGERLLPLTHPSLYALEGLLLLTLDSARDDLEGELSAGYSALAARCREGRLAENLADPDSLPRSDVTAQLLRVGCGLAGRGVLPEARLEELVLMAERLRDFAGPGGGLWFRLPGAGPPRHQNTWCTMFAHQAVAYLAELQRSGTIPGDWIRCLV